MALHKHETEKALRESEERCSGRGAQLRAVMEAALDGIVPANSRGDIIYANTATERLFGYSAEELAAQSVTLLIPERSHEAHRSGLSRFLLTGEARMIGRTVEVAGKRRDASEFPLELSLASWKAGGAIFFTAVLRDITERKRFEEAQAALVVELQQALNEVKTLSGLIPICANCKKVRDDAGFWQEVETYVRDRTEANFSHSICPDCGQRLYGDYWGKTTDEPRN